MTGVAKIVLELSFEEFNALDVVVNAQIAELAYQHRIAGGREVLLERLRAVRIQIDRTRPPQYAAAIRASYARSTVCET